MTPARPGPHSDGYRHLAVRRKGPPVWEFELNQTISPGKQGRIKGATVKKNQYATTLNATRAVEKRQVEASTARVGKRLTVKQLWNHFCKYELHDPEVDRSPTTIEMYYTNMNAHILPEFGSLSLDTIDTVTVEKWLRQLKHKALGPAPAGNHRGGRRTLAPATKSKLRNQLSCLFSHAKRYKLFFGENPIAGVRQGGARVSIPDLLSLSEVKSILSRLNDPAHRTLVLIAAVTALRRSEIRGLQWRDVDFETHWLSLKRGVVRNHRTKLKTEASRKGLPIPAELTKILLELRDRSLYGTPEDWIFASPSVDGLQPLWLDNILNRYVRPAARAAGITTKRVGWHTFRRSLASLLAAKGEPVHVVKELLRHAQTATTQDLYQQADTASKRVAQAHTADLFFATAAPRHNTHTSVVEGQIREEVVKMPEPFELSLRT
jgi:integrase